jgi:hypothetical protein
MADPEGQDPEGAWLIFAEHSHQDPRCGRPPRVLNTDNLGLYHGYFENRYGEPFVFTLPDEGDRHGLGWRPRLGLSSGRVRLPAILPVDIGGSGVGGGRYPRHGEPVNTF